jgi:ParB-like chromosome segregation protein Spo0J
MRWPLDGYRVLWQKPLIARGPVWKQCRAFRISGAQRMEFPAYQVRLVSELVPYARNSRTHSPQQVDKIAASIREFGFLNPIITDGRNGIVAGHGRVLAAQKLGLDKLPCIDAAHLTEAQRRAYVIADNRLALDAGWDNELLKVELQDLDAQGFDLSLTGFELGEMAALFDEPAEPADPKDLSGSAERFEVIIECADEAEQERAYNLAQSGGFECRISTF